MAENFDSRDSGFAHFSRNKVKSSISFDPPRINEVINLINSLNLRKAVGHDNIAPYFLRVASNILAPALCYFFDNAIKLGVFPRNCKIAKIIPLFKAGKKEVNNYRPISILSCLSKIFEKLIYTYLVSFFRKHSVLAETQYGFQNNKSTSHAILDVLTNAYDNIESNDYTAIVLSDFKKAFDTVCHSILLNKLEHYGIRGIALKLLKSFLINRSNRSQFVADQNLRTNDAVNRFGVPQGSNLGPLLFLIYINYIPNALFSKPRLFADDTCLVIQAPNPSLLENSVNRELVNVYEWTKANKITVNPKKTSVLIIPPKATSPPPNIHLVFNGSIIPINESVKYLGITIDKKLNFEIHIKQLESKVSRSIGIMTKLRHVLPAKALRTLYYFMIHPHLLYGIAIWGMTFKSYLKRLSNLQNRAIKQIVDCYGQSNANPCYAQPVA